MTAQLLRPFTPWTQPPYREIAGLFARPEEPAPAVPGQDIAAQHELAQSARALTEYKREQLTVKQRVFIDAYMANGFDEYKAALSAGFTEAEARRVGKKMLEKEQIREAIELTLQLYSAQSAIRLKSVLDEIGTIAFSNIGDFVNEVGEVHDTFDPTHPRMRAVKKYVREPTRYGYKQTIELHDKLGALSKLAGFLQAGGEGADPNKPAAGKAGDTIVNVQSITIIPVPQGQFLPAPPKTQLAPLVIDRTPKMIDVTPNTQINSPAHQAGASTRTSAAVPVQAGS